MVIFHSYVSLPEGNPNKGKKTAGCKLIPNTLWNQLQIH